MRLSRKRKKLLRRHAPLGVVVDPAVPGDTEREWGRATFVAEKGYGKKTWSAIWNRWNPGALPTWRGGRFVLSPAWFAARGRLMPHWLRGVA